MTPCMGGWCGLREKCPHYTAIGANRNPSERLCLPGQDGSQLIENATGGASRRQVFRVKAESLLPSQQSTDAHFERETCQH
jgi:hypothetical protein